LCIRELNSEWPTTLLFALSNELIPKFEYMNQIEENKGINGINNKYTKFIERIYELKLENVYNEKHLLNVSNICLFIFFFFTNILCIYIFTY
jgi:hypothetical protein